MITLIIIACVLVIVACIFAWNCEKSGPWFSGGIFVLLMAAISSLVSMRIPTGYIKIDNLSHVTESGYVETIEGDYFSDGENYYVRKAGKSKWIPFAPCEYVKVALPINNGSQTHEY